ncbi:SDR family NAD(P)-dependent oxidoreductase [Sabulicella glaciei]|uniref:SDR family oxidoreductase n=1 Tax=Sabulicella glaciei TaxID=2984948 RepID=A0ABT3NU12_9PROT|nr:SDR family oxidoreductase [Roseococcus sp. MDT2-1-1]MCW8085639.1 SDR family oxidoreductase [Roseococcus sp. MDT2-1-1]
MMWDLSGRVALVTGGNGGIGLGMAKALAANGAALAITGRNAAKNEAAAKELPGQTLVIEADLTAKGAHERVLDEVRNRHGRLDILVNNAGTNIRKRPEEVTDADWETVLDTNLGSLMRMTRGAYPMLKQHRVGRVINIGSILSIFGMPFSPAYGASKGAVVQYTKSLATAWAAEGITVNAVLPGWIETELTDGARATVPGLYERQAARTPMGRWGKPDDLGGIAAFLASDAAGFVTGTAIPVDGGFAAMG